MSALKLLAAFLWSHMEKVVRGASITPLSNVLKFFTAAACQHVDVRSAGEDDTCTGRSQVQSASRPSLDEGHEQREKRKRPR